MGSKKNNILLALLMSFVFSVLGGVIFGLIYQMGYYLYVLPIAIVCLACIMYFKYADKSKKYNVAIAVISSIIFSIIFMYISILIVEAGIIAKEYKISLTDSFKVLLELFKTDQQSRDYLIRRIVEITVMMFVGGAIYIILYFIESKNQKNIKQKQNGENSDENTKDNQSVFAEIKNKNDITNPPKVRAIEVEYSNLYNKCSDAYNKYIKNKNQEEFKQELLNIKKNIMYTQQIKKHLIEYAELKNSQLSDKNDIAVNKLMLKLLNK